jgi:hypothetical protein
MKKLGWFALALTMTLGSCQHFLGKRVRGNGNIKTEDRSVGSFKNVEISATAKILLSQGDQHSVKVEGDENLLPYVEVNQDGDKIIIRDRPGFVLRPTGDLRIYITSPVFSEIDASGASDIVSQNKISNPEELSMRLSGAGDVKMEVDAPRFTFTMSGAGSIYLKGQTKDVELHMSGAGSAHFYDLLAENVQVNISGVGSAEVYGSVKIQAQISGAGSISYKGNASDVSKQVSGIGSINKAD